MLTPRIQSNNSNGGVGGCCCLARKQCVLRFDPCPCASFFLSYFVKYPKKTLLAVISALEKHRGVYIAQGREIPCARKTSGAVLIRFFNDISLSSAQAMYHVGYIVGRNGRPRGWLYLDDTAVSTRKNMSYARMQSLKLNSPSPCEAQSSAPPRRGGCAAVLRHGIMHE